MKSPTKSGYYKPTAITKWRLSPLGSPLKLAPSQPFHRASSCPQMWSFPWSMTGWSAHTERTQSREEMMKKKWRLEAWGKEAKKQDCRGLYCCCGKGSVPDLGISTCCGHGQKEKGNCYVPIVMKKFECCHSQYGHQFVLVEDQLCLSAVFITTPQAWNSD